VFRNELCLPFACPVCGETIVWDIERGGDPVVCPKCNASVEVPASVKQNAALFKAADTLRKK
jgi:transcription initiation factor IIE alpha subunit